MSYINDKIHNSDSSLSIRRICGWALCVRLFALLCVITLSPYVSTGFFGSTNDQDDVRLLAGAEIYKRTAEGIIDRYALQLAFDDVEKWASHDEDTFMDMDYWLVSVGMYIFNSDVIVRFFYILFAVYSVKCIYDIAMVLYGVKVARLSSSLYALLPYPVFFSCFLYKDQFYTLVTLLLFRKAFLCAGHIRANDILYLLFFLFLSLWIRSGLVVLVVATIFLIIYNRGNYKMKLWQIVLSFALIVFFFSIIIYISWDKIVMKVTYYILDFSSSGDGIINYFTIKSPAQLYRYPFSYFFLLLQPLGYEIKAETWYEFVGTINFVAIPIAIGNVLYLFSVKNRKSFFFWTMQVFYLLTIITSLDVPRHYFYLQPFTLLFFSVYICQAKSRLLLTTSSSVAIVGILCLLIII